MFLDDIFETVDRGKLGRAIESFESHLNTLDVESDKAADILQAVFGQVSNEFKLDADTQIALSDYLKKEHNLFNLLEEVIPLRRSETQKYDDAIANQQGIEHSEFKPKGFGVSVVDDYLLPVVTAGKIPDEYATIQDWLWDFWPELDWNDPREDIKEILNHPRYNEIVSFFQENYNFNFDKELKGSFYNYFESKEDFVIQALQYSADHCIPIMEETLKDSSLPPLQRIEKFYQERIVQFRECNFTLGCFGSNLCIEMGDISVPIGGATEAYFKQLESVLLSCLQEAQDAGDLDKSKNIDKLAKFIYNSWNGALLRMKASRSQEPLNIFTEMLTDLFR